MIRPLFRMLGAGRFPADLLPAGERCKAVYVGESLSGSIILRNFRSPHGYASWKYKWFCGGLAITRSRFIIRRGFSNLLDVELKAPGMRGVHVTTRRNSTLRIAHSANLFQPEWSGEIEYRFYNADADYLAKQLAPYTAKAHACSAAG